jgi:GNAT superfamily N-acetyltransferase/DNA-binding PadR family transcriptional regulator
MEVLELRRTLDLDPGYLSRLLARFEADGLVVRERSSSDARRQLVRLTEQGVAVARMLDERSETQIRALLDGLPAPHRERMVTAMRTIHEILDADFKASEPPFTLRPAGPGDYGWVVQRNGAVYAAEYGWDSTYEALVARIVADYIEGRDEKRENAWIAELDGRPVGCVFCVKEDDDTARLRLLLVDPAARGLGVGSALVEECLRFATEAGYREMVLWTNDVLVSARRIYERAGFTLTDSSPHHSFGHDLTGQTWRRPLQP